MTEPTETITIRVPKSLKEKLEVLSHKDHLNLNLLVNQILTRGVHWDEQMTKMGWLQLNPETVKGIFELLEEEEILKLSHSIKKDIVNGIKFIYGDSEIEHVVEFINTWLTATNLPFRYTQENGSHKFFINHNIGKNWSIFATSVTAEFIKELGFKISDLQTDSKYFGYTISK